jgi:hypothetical protein
LGSASSCEAFRFFETEGIAIMTLMVSKYKIEIKEESEFVGETFEERYARVTAFKQGLTTRYVISIFPLSYNEHPSVLHACLWYLRGDNCVTFTSRPSSFFLFDMDLRAGITI